MEWTTACTDWAGRLKKRQSIIPAPIFPEEAERALAVFKRLRIVDAPGSPTFGEACAQWVFDFVAAIFGSYDAETGNRLIKEVFLLISKKNSKSTLAAGVMVTALIMNWRQSAELIILAPTVEVAGNSFAPARDMIRADPELSEIFLVQEHIRTITHRVTKATLKVVAADNDTVGGKKASWILIDEEWLFGKKPNAENMFREAMGGLASRPEGVLIKLSTQSDDPPAGIFRQDLIYARKVRDGATQDKAYLPVLYEFPPDMVERKDYLDPSNFYITNPNMGLSVDVAFIEREFAKAKEAGEESLRGFLAKHLNVEIGLALRSDRWSGADYWEQQTDKSITLESLLERCEVVDVGIDGGGNDDLLGLAVAGREAGTGRWLLWARAWANPPVLARRKSEAPRFRDFERDGDLVICEAVGHDVREVTEICVMAYESGKLDKICVDPAGIGAVLQAIERAGVPDGLVIGISQGYMMSGAIKTVERALAARELWHAGQPMMAWCVGNAKVVPKGNAIFIDKQVNGTAKIDPLMAAFDAISRLSLNPAAQNITPEIFAL